MSETLPYFQSDVQPLSLMQTRWRSILNPLLNVSILSGNLISNISLSSTKPTVINTLLSRMQKGWVIVDQNAASSIYRSAPLNSQTLTLTSSADCIISLWVF